MLPTVELLPEAEPDQETIEVVLYFDGDGLSSGRNAQHTKGKKALPAALLMN